MKRLRISTIAAACTMLAGVGGLATTAGAYTTCQGDTNCSLGANAYTFGTNDVFGGGSSLVAPYWRQTSDCYANPADLITKGSPPTFVDEALINYKSAGPQNCATTHIITTATTWYISTGSGSGILGVMSHDPKTFYGEVNTNGPQYFPEVFYGLSDAGLGSTDVSAYNSGGSYSQGSTTISIGAPGAVPCSNQAQTQPYANPAYCYGPLVQFPFSVDPVDIFYTNKGVYEKVYDDSTSSEIDYKLNVQNPTSNGGLRLSVSSICGIYNGQITNWNDSRLTTDNGGISLEDPNDMTPTSSWSVPLYAVGRSDSSGTTSIITRHLANVCAQYSYNLYTTGATTLQKAGSGMGAIIGNAWNTSTPNWPGTDVPGKITLVANSSGVAEYVNFSQSPAGEGDNCGNAVLPSGYTDCIWQSRVGYVGNDYTVPYVKNSHTNSFSLYSANLQNSSGAWISPSPTSAAAAFKSLLPPQSNGKGQYCASCLKFGHRNDPTAWVQGLSPTSVLANPPGATAYPLVGTTNFLGYTCYANATTVGNLVGQIGYIQTKPINWEAHTGILALSGLSSLPQAWRNAIEGTFVNNTDNLSLNIVAAGTGTVCSASNIVGG